MKKINQGWLKFGVIYILIFSLSLLIMAPQVFAQQRFSQTFKKGDALRLTVWQPWRTIDTKSAALNLGGDYRIDSRGYAFFPLIGEVNVLSHNTTSLAADLKEKFSAYMQDPVIVVEPLIRVTLIGAFKKPGTYLVRPDASLWEVVDLAEGPESNANLEKMAVARTGKKVKEKLLTGFERAYSIEELGVRSGDQILLPHQGGIGLRDVLDVLRFGISILQLYLLITRL